MSGFEESWGDARAGRDGLENALLDVRASEAGLGTQARRRNILRPMTLIPDSELF
jgi:hypothetical protein